MKNSCMENSNASVSLMLTPFFMIGNCCKPQTRNFWLARCHRYHCYKPATFYHYTGATAEQIRACIAMGHKGLRTRCCSTFSCPDVMSHVCHQAVTEQAPEAPEETLCSSSATQNQHRAAAGTCLSVASLGSVSCALLLS